MEHHYVVFVEFVEQLNGRAPLTQTLDVHSAGPEFDLLLHALNASSDIATLNVYSKTPTKMFRVTRDDLGYLSPNVMRKLK